VEGKPPYAATYSLAPLEFPELIFYKSTTATIVTKVDEFFALKLRKKFTFYSKSTMQLLHELSPYIGIPHNNNNV